MSIEANKDIVHSFIDDVVNNAHPEKATEYLAPDFVVYFPGEAEPIKREDLPQFFSRMRTAFPDWNIWMEDMVAEGDNVVVIGTQSGTHQGPYQGMPATGKSYKVRNHVLYRLRDGRIIEARPAFDRLSIMEQLGIWQPSMAGAGAMAGASR